MLNFFVVTSCYCFQPDDKITNKQKLELLVKSHEALDNFITMIQSMDLETLDKKQLLLIKQKLQELITPAETQNKMLIEVSKNRFYEQQAAWALLELIGFTPLMMAVHLVARDDPYKLEVSELTNSRKNASIIICLLALLTHSYTIYNGIQIMNATIEHKKIDIHKIKKLLAQVTQLEKKRKITTTRSD